MPSIVERLRHIASELEALADELAKPYTRPHPDGCKVCDPSKPCKHLERLRAANAKED